jgi:hypothetical protein
MGAAKEYDPNLTVAEQKIGVAESHNFYATPALGKNFDAAPAPLSC